LERGRGPLQGSEKVTLAFARRSKSLSGKCRGLSPFCSPERLLRRFIQQNVDCPPRVCTFRTDSKLRPLVPNRIDVEATSDNAQAWYPCQPSTARVASASNGIDHSPLGTIIRPLRGGSLRCSQPSRDTAASPAPSSGSTRPDSVNVVGTCAPNNRNASHLSIGRPIRFCRPRSCREANP
jgi:hypothetical protein